MPAKSWTIDAADGVHTVVLARGRLFGRRGVTVDGAAPPVETRRQWWRETVVETFPVGAERAELVTEPRGFAQWHHALRVGDREIEPRLPRIAVPRWAGLPVFGCFAPFAFLALQSAPTLAVALAGLMGGGGAAACLAFARDPGAAERARQRACAATVLFVWALLALPSVVLSAAFALLPGVR